MADELTTGVAGAEGVPASTPEAPDAGVAAPQPSSPGEGEGVAGAGEGQQEGEKTVPVHVLVAERREWQKKLEKLEAVESELDQMRRLMMQNMTPPPAPKEPDYDPDHFMTYADFVALEEKKEAIRKAESFEQKYSENLAAARSKYTDFDSVIANLKAEMKKHPELGGIEQFDNHPNGPFWAYRLGKQIESERKITPNRALDAINQNLNRPATLAQATGGTNMSLDEFTRVMNMPEAEFQKEWAKRKGFQ